MKIDVNVTVRDNTRTYEIDAPNGLSNAQLQYWLSHNLHNATEKKVKTTEKVTFACDFNGTYKTTASCEVPRDVVVQGRLAIKHWLAENESDWEYEDANEVIDCNGMSGLPYGFETPDGEALDAN
jgi:hypothetical protein